MYGTANSDPDITSDLTHTEIRISTEIVFANGTVTLGPSMPSPTEEPGFNNVNRCLVNLIGGDIMIMGQASIQPEENRVYRYNPSTNTYTRQADMIYKKHHGDCASFYSAKHGNRHVIYFGGGYQTGRDALLLDYTVTEEWEARKFVTQKYCNHANSLYKYSVL